MPLAHVLSTGALATSRASSFGEVRLRACREILCEWSQISAGCAQQVIAWRTAKGPGHSQLVQGTRKRLRQGFECMAAALA